jgi:ribose/xylose/arabinose/galactoside ABC-type transport system permease subunit
LGDLQRLWRRIDKTSFVLNNVLLLALVAMGGYFSTQTSRFLQISNFQLILSNNAPLGVLCAVFALLVITGGVDLSVGSNIGLSGLITALAVTSWGFPNGLGIILGILAGAGVGVINGTFCGILRFNPIIVTLGMLGVIRGVALIIHEQDINGLSGVFNTVAYGKVVGVYVIVIIVAASFIIAAAFVALTPWGRYLYAIGLSREAAYLSALPVRALPFALYVATGAAAGLAGVLTSAQLDGGSAGSEGLTMELQALTIILLGGVAFAGGRGRLFGVFIAWVFLGTLEDGLILMNVTPFVQQVASGMALVLAAALDWLGIVIRPRLQLRREVATRLGAHSAARGPADANTTQQAGTGEPE